MSWRTAILCALVALPAAAHALPGDVVSEMQAPGRTCTGLAFDGKLVWVADHVADTLFALDPVQRKVVAQLKSPGYRPAGLAFDGEQLWNVDVTQALVFRLRPSDGLITRTLPSPVSQPRALAWDGAALWLSDDKGKTIHQVDPSDGTTIREIPFPAKSVDGLAHDGRYLWVADRLADKLFALEPEHGEVIATLRAPGPHVTGLEAVGEGLMAVDYQADRIYTVRKDDREHVIRRQPRDAWVVFTHQVRNFGPDPLVGVDTYLALPRDLTSQTLLSEPYFNREPNARLTDRWGQPSAHFHGEFLTAGKADTVEMKVHLRAWDVSWVVYPEKVKSLKQIPRDIRRRYLVDAPKYDLKHPTITEAVAEVVGKERNPYWIARKLYRHVHQKMRYERVGGWDVAPKVLARGTGSCSEYSYVYIALCRAAGLPARYVGSLVVRKDDASYDDVYHRWVEVYLPPYGWVPVDPSRGDKATEAKRAEGFGHLTHDFLVTTHGGGGSEQLGWGYNAQASYTCKGRCRVEFESIAEWSPEDPDRPYDLTRPPARAVSGSTPRTLSAPSAGK